MIRLALFAISAAIAVYICYEAATALAAIAETIAHVPGVRP